MNDKGPTIRRAFLGLRRFFEDVAILLQTAEMEMGKAGWSTLKSDTACTGSKRVDSPKYWMPHFAFRTFTKESAPTILAYVTTLFVSPEADDTLDEPLVIAGGIEYKGPATWEGLSLWRHLYLHPYLPDAECEGQFQETRDQKLLHQDDVIVLFSMASPLVRITDATSLNDCVIEPLKRELQTRICGTA